MTQFPPANDQAFQDADICMPLGGLGLPLAEAQRCGIPDDQYAAALNAVLLPPVINVGAKFSPMTADAELSIVEMLVWQWLDYKLSGAPDPERPALQGLSHEQLHFLLPSLDLPGTGYFWTSAAHAAQLLTYLDQNGISVAMLPPQDKWPHPCPKSLPFALPRAEGAVEPGHVTRFFAVCPALGRRISKALPWRSQGARRCVPADIANNAVRRFLGIEADLRIGSLVSDFEIEQAIGLAAGDGNNYQYGRLGGFIDRLVPRVTSRHGRPYGMGGAAWSCAVDTALNGPASWTPGGDRGYLTVDEVCRQAA